MNNSILPYDPAVKRRIVFTSWHLVMPGWFTWDNDQGQPMDIDADAAPDALVFHGNNTAWGIRLIAQPAEKHVKLDLPQGVNFNTIVYDRDRYRAWGGLSEYMGMVNTQMVCYESTDGYHWTCVNSDPDVIFNSGGQKHVFIDPSAPAQERYKMVIDHYPKGIGAAVSPDGVHWTEFPQLILEDDADSQNTGYYDTRLGKYVIYHRARRGKTPTEFKSRWQRRAIARSESADFHKFPPSEIILEGNDPQFRPNVDLYMNCRTTIPHAPLLHLMFPNIYHRDTDTVSVYLASSIDGKSWRYLPGGPVITTANEGQPNGGCIFSYPNLIELPDGSFALHIIGNTLPHKYPRGRQKATDYYALWPKGRIIALEAQTKGRFTMLPIPAVGHRLRINAVTKRAGYIKIELMQNLERKMLTEPPAIPGYTVADCDPIIGDCYQKIVTWKGQSDLGVEQGKPLILRVELNRAKLFSLELIGD